MPTGPAIRYAQIDPTEEILSCENGKCNYRDDVRHQHLSLLEAMLEMRHEGGTQPRDFGGIPHRHQKRRGPLACQPVIAIRWREGMFILLLIALLIGPPVYRFLRRLENSHRQKEK